MKASAIDNNKTVIKQEPLCLIDAVEKFRRYLRVTYSSERTIRTYKEYVAIFHRFLRQQYLTHVTEITPEVILEYQYSLCSKNEYNDKELSVKTQSLRMVVVIVFLRFLYRHGYIEKDLASDIKLPRVPRTLPKTILSRREMLKILREPKGTDLLEMRDKAMLELFYSSGLRNTEMRTLKIYDVDFSNGLVKVLGKGSKERIIPMGKVASRYIKVYLEKARPNLAKKQTDILFLTKNGNMFTDDFPAEMVRKYAERAGIKKQINAHTLRHTFATHMLKRKANLRVIQEMMGHESLQTTEIYTHVEVSDLKRVHSQTHPRERDLI